MGISINSSPFAFHFMLVVNCVQSSEETCTGFSERSLSRWKVCPAAWFKLGTSEFPGQLLCYRGPFQNVWMDVLAFVNTPIYSDRIEHPFMIWVGFEFFLIEILKSTEAAPCHSVQLKSWYCVLESKLLYVTCCCSDNHSAALKLQLVFKNASPPDSLLTL